MTSETDYDAYGIAVPGTYAISAVGVFGARADGAPVAVATSAVCDVCGDWACHLWVTGSHSTTMASAHDHRISRRQTVVVFACPKHYDQVGEDLVAEYGHAGNSYAPDELAHKIERSQPRRPAQRGEDT